MSSNVVMGWASGTSASNTNDASFTRAGNNSIVYGAIAAAGGVTSRTHINVTKTGIADATATTLFTVTIPNAAHSALIRVLADGDVGAGGAIGAFEAGAASEYLIKVNRTAGVNAVATISTIMGSAAANVAGATTATVTCDLGAVSGAVGAANTFTIRVTITKAGGSSANHTCTGTAELLNANASGITIA